MDGDDFEDTLLHEAVRYGDVSDVKTALKEGNDPNQIGIYQWNPLHEASNNGDLSIVKLLVKYGGDPNKSDLLRGSTAVHYAASNSHVTVLKVLLKAGGKYDCKNNDGQTCLDVAEGFECQKLLRQQRDRELIIPEEAKLDPVAQLSESQNHLEDLSYQNDGSLDRVSLSSELDTISIETNSSSSSRPHSRAWGTDRLLGIKELVIGHVQLSFEYNAKKKTYKVRVWQVSDMLFPPSDSSMISSVYVKSFLQPDKKKETKRKTEELKVDKIDLKEIKKKGQEHIVNFQPVCFKFSKPLEYENISKDTIDSRFVEIEFCVVQRYTRKSYVVATFNMPVKASIKKLVKEKFPLKPVLSTSLPENMKVYSPNEADLAFSRNCRSNPNLDLRRASSRSSLWAKPYEDQRAVSDSDLRRVTVDTQEKQKSSIEVCIQEEDRELQHALEQIAVMEGDTVNRHQDHSILNVPLDTDPHGYQDEDGLNVLISDPIRMAEVQIHVPKATSEDFGRKTLQKPRKSTEKRSSKFLKGKGKGDKQSDNDKSKRAHPNVSSLEDEEASIGLPSRSESPSWDYYSEPLLFPAGGDVEAPLADTPTLPMACSFHLPAVHSSFSRWSTGTETAASSKYS